MPHTRKELLSWAKDAWEKIIGKHPEEVTIKGWVARDKNKAIWFYTDTPIRNIKQCCWYGVGCSQLLQEDFPSVQWSDEEPTQVTITIKIEK